MMKKTLIASALVAVFATSAQANEETQELRNVIAEQQAVLEKLEKRLDETEQRLEATADQVEASDTGSNGKTGIGGYGELHYNNYKGSDAKIDFHRFVLFFGHEFTNDIRFFSEFELEHALSGDGKPGEVELEQAYVEIDHNDAVSSKVGLFLIPVGILNETHEPPTFYGVERNPVEKNIIPSTWWEAGAAVNYKATPGLAVDAAVTSGLFVGEDFNIRSGRQKVASAKAENFGYTARVKYTAIPGLELAATAQYQSDVRQGKGAVAASATLFETHAIYSYEGFGIRALYARWDIEGSEAQALGRDKQTGMYIEPSYRFNDEVGAFARYAEYDNNAGNSSLTKVKSSSVGVNYWVHENVVLKADYEDLSGAKNDKGFNLGFGYMF